MASINPQTSWTDIIGSAAGNVAARERFATTYEPVVRSYLAARWANVPLAAAIDDGVQDVFVECFRAQGVLERVNPETVPSFRGYLFGVLKNVARRYEAKDRIASLPDQLEADDTSASAAFDREYALAMMREASYIQAALATKKGAAAERRIELLQLRFGQGLPVREIAKRWEVDPAWVHHQYATARSEFQESLECLIQQHEPRLSAAEVTQRCRDLLQALSGKNQT